MPSERKIVPKPRTISSRFRQPVRRPQAQAPSRPMAPTSRMTYQAKIQKRRPRIWVCPTAATEASMGLLLKMIWDC